MSPSWGVNRPVQPQQLPENAPQSAPDTSDVHCPECGSLLQNAEHARKHKIAHYGDLPLPILPTNFEARKRAAFLLGKEAPTE